jgi:hypothetical protein
MSPKYSLEQLKDRVSKYGSTSNLDYVKAQRHDSTPQSVCVTLYEAVTRVLDDFKNSCGRDKSKQWVYEKYHRNGPLLAISILNLKCTVKRKNTNEPYAVFIYRTCSSLRTGGPASTIRNYLNKWKRAPARVPKDTETEYEPESDSDDDEVQEVIKPTPVSVTADVVPDTTRRVADLLADIKKTIPPPKFEFNPDMFKLPTNKRARVDVEKLSDDLVHYVKRVKVAEQHIKKLEALNTKLVHYVKRVKVAADSQEQRIKLLEASHRELIDFIKTWAPGVNSRLYPYN